VEVAVCTGTSCPGLDVPSFPWSSDVGKDSSRSLRNMDPTQIGSAERSAEEQRHHGHSAVFLVLGRAAGDDRGRSVI